jgi:hypothetical protein
LSANGLTFHRVPPIPVDNEIKSGAIYRPKLCHQRQETLRQLGLTLTDATQSNSDLRVCSLHGWESIRRDIAWTTTSGTKMLDSFTFQVPNPAGEKSPMKQKSPGSNSKGIGEICIALKQIGQANDILRNQQGHEHFSHIDLAMYNVTRDAMHEENDENAPPIDPQIAFELGLLPKTD